jgi:signal transduction histidine kinase
LSASAGPEARTEGLDAGADDYLVKPFVANELVARVRSLIELGRLRRAQQQEVVRMNAALEQRVEERTAALEASNAELAGMARTMAHDLRAPLRALERYAHALQEDFADRPLDPVGLGYADRIRAAARRMDALLTGLLEYEKLGRAQMRQEAVATQRVAEELIRAHPAWSHVRVEGALPALLGDPAVVERVLCHLVSNACTFVPRGEAPDVCITGETSGADGRILVRDRGIGIAAEHHERIFRPFERLHGRGTYEGTGIGLAIVHRAVTRMGGRVGVCSTAGQGAEFWFELPKAPG